MANVNPASPVAAAPKSPKKVDPVASKPGNAGKQSSWKYATPVDDDDGFSSDEDERPAEKER
jgi:hypothetical protein